MVHKVYTGSVLNLKPFSDASHPPPQHLHIFKGLVHPKMKMLSVMTHPHVVRLSHKTFVHLRNKNEDIFD